MDLSAGRWWWAAWMTAASAAAADAAVFAAAASNAARKRPPHPFAADIAAPTTSVTAATAALWAPDFPLPRTYAADMEAMAASKAGARWLHVFFDVAAVVVVSRAVIALIIERVDVPLPPLSALPEALRPVVENDEAAAAAACRVVPSKADSSLFDRVTSRAAVDFGGTAAAAADAVGAATTANGAC